MVEYISSDEVAAMIKSDKVPRKDYLIVDVRDDDWVGGNIKGSHNSPARMFATNVDGLVRGTKDVPVLVFHCTLSQVRGPKAARIYKEARDRILSDTNDTPPKVVVLHGGFSQFQSKFRDDPQLVENWDAKVWDDKYWEDWSH